MEAKFKVILDFIIAFKMKYKLKIVPKIQVDGSMKCIEDKVIENNNFEIKPQAVSQSFGNISQKQVKVSRVP